MFERLICHPNFQVRPLTSIDSLKESTNEVLRVKITKFSETCKLVQPTMHKWPKVRLFNVRVYISC